MVTSLVGLLTFCLIGNIVLSYLVGVALGAYLWEEKLSQYRSVDKKGICKLTATES